MNTEQLNKLLRSYNIPEVSIDFYKNNIVCIQSKQLDTARYILITLTENGIPRKLTTERALFRAGKPDNTYVYNEEECIILEDGRLLVELTEQTLAVKGKIEADIQLICTNNKIYSTKKFFIEAASLPYDESAVESSNEFNALNRLISEESGRVETLKELEKTTAENESIRQENEGIRKTNEENRVAAEEEREIEASNAVANANIATANAIQAASDALSAAADATQATTNADQSTQTANTIIEEMRSLIADDNIVHTNILGHANGVATLDEEGFLSKSQIPDRTIEIIYGELLDDGTFLDTDGLEITGGINKQYIDTKKGLPYIWSGSEFLSTGSSLGLGITSSTAFPGDRGLALESFHNNLTADKIKYNNTGTALLSANVQEAITELTANATKDTNYTLSKPIYSNTAGTIIDFCQENIDTMVSVRITGNGYDGHNPIDCIYQFYNHSSGIIASSGIANGSPLTLKVFRHGGRCKGWVVQSRTFQTLQIAVTFEISDSNKPTFTTGAMPTSGVTNLTEITPYTSYHTGRKPTYSDTGAAPTSHASTALTYGGGTAVNFGHVKLSDAYNSYIGGAANSIGASQDSVYTLYRKLTKLYKLVEAISNGWQRCANASREWSDLGVTYKCGLVHEKRKKMHSDRNKNSKWRGWFYRWWRMFLFNQPSRVSDNLHEHR